MENKQPLISILIPTYNRPEYLKECINSVLTQKGFNNNELEIIISDNSTNNDTKIIVEKVIIDYLDKIIIFNKNSSNIGMIGNWNKLLELKSGKYFIFLSDDDKFYNDNSLKILYDLIIEKKGDLVYGNSFIDRNGKLEYIKFHLTNGYEMFKNNCISFGGTLYKNKGYYYDLNAGYYADYDFNLEYVIGGNILYIDKDTFIYRIHNNQITNSINGIDDKKMKLYIFNKHKGYYYNLLSYIKLLLVYIIIYILVKLGLYNYTLKTYLKCVKK
ncbi:MAG: glycosyltransferase [Candidatus Gracilibacteria bacterium]|nr:glycosyltransferase [Candidatus Gracilibacteria bacterium]